MQEDYNIGSDSDSDDDTNNSTIKHSTPTKGNNAKNGLSHIEDIQKVSTIFDSHTDSFRISYI